MKLVPVEDSDKVMVRDNDKCIYVLFPIDLSQSCQLIFFFFSVHCSGLRIKFCHDMRKQKDRF